MKHFIFIHLILRKILEEGARLRNLLLACITCTAVIKLRFELGLQSLSSITTHAALAKW